MSVCCKPELGGEVVDPVEAHEAGHDVGSVVVAHGQHEVRVVCERQHGGVTEAAQHAAPADAAERLERIGLGLVDLARSTARQNAAASSTLIVE